MDPVTLAAARSPPRSTCIPPADSCSSSTSASRPPGGPSRWTIRTTRAELARGWEHHRLERPERGGESVRLAGDGPLGKGFDVQVVERTVRWSRRCTGLGRR